MMIKDKEVYEWLNENSQKNFTVWAENNNYAVFNDDAGYCYSTTKKLADEFIKTKNLTEEEVHKNGIAYYNKH